MDIDRSPTARMLIRTDAQRAMLRYAGDVVRRAAMLEQIDHSPFADVVAHGIALATRRR